LRQLVARVHPREGTGELAEHISLAHQHDTTWTLRVRDEPFAYFEAGRPERVDGNGDLMFGADP